MYNEMRPVTSRMCRMMHSKGRTRALQRLRRVASASHCVDRMNTRQLSQAIPLTTILSFNADLA